MDDSAFTAGEWRPHHKGATRIITTIDGETYTLANCWSSPLSPPRYEAAANARLMAAAKELLAACEQLAGWTGTLVGPEAAPLLAAARAAVAKAKGGGSL